MEFWCGLAVGFALVVMFSAIAYMLYIRRRKAGAVRCGRWVYDLELCLGVTELIRFLEEVNCCGYLLVCVTENEEGYYTLFFRRPEVLGPDG